MLIKNFESHDLSNLLHTALENLDYPSRQINNYVFLIEEALMQWREGLDDESELSFTRNDHGNDVVFEFPAEGCKCDPFAKDVIINYEKPIRTMYDKLLSGIGTELRYSYRKGVNRITLRLPKTDVRDMLFRRLAMSSILPFSVQFLITCICANMGILILGFFSSEAMSGVSFASQLVTIHTMLINCTSTAVSSILSQFWGKRKGSSAVYAMWAATVFSTLVCLVEFIACFFFPAKLVGLYTNIPELVAEGAAYLKIASVSFLFNSFCTIFYSFLRVTNQSATVTKIVLSGCVLNFVLNLLLVFGFFGLPRLGAVGCGIAMTAGVVLQFILCFLCYRKIRSSFYNANDEINRSQIIHVFFKNIVPVVMGVVFYLVGVNFIAAAIGRLNADIIAAYSFVNAVNAHLFGIKDGCASTAGILTGLRLGQNRFEDAKYEHKLLTRLTFKISAVTMLSLIVIVFLSRFLPVQLNDAAKQYLFPISVYFAINGMFVFQNGVNNNTLYAGGQPRPVFIVDTINALCVNTVIALISIKLNCFAPLLLLALCKIDEIVTFFPKVIVIRQGKWLRNIVE